MPLKYILIKELYAKSPFPDGQIRFLVKRRDKDQPIHSQIQFCLKPISSYPQEYMELSYEAFQSNQLALFVIAISSNNRVVNLGCIHLCLDQNVWEKKEYLKGIIQQNGFVIYSSRDEPFPEKAALSMSKANSMMIRNIQQTVKQSINKSQGKNNSQAQETPLKLLQYSSQKSNFFSQAARTESPQYSNNQSLIGMPYCTTQFKQTHCLSETLRAETPVDCKIFPDCDKMSQASRVPPSEAYQQAAIILKQHKLKNSQYKQHLMQMQAEFQQQQIKLKQLGLSHT